MVVCVTAISSSVEAKDPVRTPGVRGRERAQRARIAQGVQSGELTGQETKTLTQEEKSIRQEKRAARADGSVTPAERKALQQDQNKVSKDIYDAKHNDQKRPVYSEPVQLIPPPKTGAPTTPSSQP